MYPFRATNIPFCIFNVSGTTPRYPEKNTTAIYMNTSAFTMNDKKTAPTKSRCAIILDALLVGTLMSSGIRDEGNAETGGSDGTLADAIG